MIIIWYNPDQDQYQKGTMIDYDRLIMVSELRDRFDILYEFNQTSIRLAEKILSALNLVRKGLAMRGRTS
jgi:hypothetical protein